MTMPSATTARFAVAIVVSVLLTSGMSTDGVASGAAEYRDGQLVSQEPTIPGGAHSRAEVINSFPVPDTYCNGLAWDGATLWLCGGFSGMIYQLDPADGTILNSYNPGIASLRGMTYGDGHLWTDSWSTRQIYELVPATGQIVHQFLAPFAGKPHGLAWDNGVLWLGEEDGLIYRVDPVTGVVERSIVPPSGCCFNPRGVAWDGMRVWTGYQSVGVIYALDPATGMVLDSFAAPSGGLQQGVAFDGQYLWSTGGDNVVYQIDIGLTTPVQSTRWGAIKALYR